MEFWCHGDFYIFKDKLKLDELFVSQLSKNTYFKLILCAVVLQAAC